MHHGTQKITMGRGKDTDYQSKKAAAIAQAGHNDFIFGIQSVYENGSGEASKASRHPKYGNSNLMAGDQIDGATGIFKPRFDAAGNQIIGDPLNTTGFADGGTSATIQPQIDPEIAGDMAAQRVAMIAQGMQFPGLNDRQQIYGV